MFVDVEIDVIVYLLVLVDAVREVEWGCLGIW